MIGEHLPHSFSGKYFASKFEAEGIKGCEYSLYELPQIEALEELLRSTPEIEGFNVTIPYKQQVMQYLTSLSAEAEAIGAVNCVTVNGDKLVGYNTDVIGFRDSLLELLAGEIPSRALILGTGGASLAVEYIMRDLDIDYQVVSRKSSDNRISYEQLTKEIIESHKLIINATPLGTFPNVNTAPNLPYDAITPEHYLFDLVYNPPLTKFLEEGKSRGAKICNGEAMLIGQAEAAWKIWNSRQG